MHEYWKRKVFECALSGKLTTIATKTQAIKPNWVGVNKFLFLPFLFDLSVFYDKTQV